MRYYKYFTAILALLLTVTLHGAESLSLPVDNALVTAALKGYRAALVIVELPSGNTYRYHEELCRDPLSPCSTFKIANALCALENGLVDTEDSVINWDGQTRANVAWNKNLTLKQAISVSAVPHFQQLASQAGAATMQTFINRINYGNRDLSGGITTFWLDSSLKISADEQVKFLRGLITGKLPITPHSWQVVHNILFQSEGKHGRLYGKTGSLSDESGHLKMGWYVGWIESNDNKTYIFALNLRDGVKPSGSAAKNIALKLFEKMELL